MARQPNFGQRRYRPIPSDHGFETVIRALDERYPLLRAFTLGRDGSRAEHGQGLPRLLGVLLSTLEKQDTGATCVVLPSHGRMGFSLSLLAVLVLLKRSFAELELDRLTTPLSPGTRVRVAPEDRVFEVVEDGREEYGRRWILLRNPTDDQVSFLPENEAFRLTPTKDSSPRPRKGQRPGKWTASPIDQLLGIRTGGNLGVVPNRIALIAPRAFTSDLADSTRILGRSVDSTAAELVTWGRIAKDGRVLSEDGPREPMIAVTHSVDFMAEACRRADNSRKMIIVDGARGIASNLQAFDDIVSDHRLLVLSDHSEIEYVRVLSERSCKAWAPHTEPLIALQEWTGDQTDWFSKTFHATKHCHDLQIEPQIARDSDIARLHEILIALDTEGTDDDETRRLLGWAWSLLITVASWLEKPGPAGMEYFDRKLGELREGLERRRMWIARPTAAALGEFIEAAEALSRREDIGREKKETLLEALHHDNNVVVVTRSVPGAARVRGMLEDSAYSAAVHPISAVPEERVDRLILCSWPGRKRMAGLVSQYSSPRLDLLAYPFEEEWLRSYTGRWLREWTRFSQPGSTIREITGISEWPRRPPRGEVKLPSPPEVGSDDDDPITRWLTRGRKGGSPAPVAEKDARDARYVGFHGNGYCFLTEGHKIPVLTDLLLGGELPADKIPLLPVRKLVPGDFVLFRDQGDKDVISTIAEYEVGEETYQELRRIADIWRPALQSIGNNPHLVWKRLRRAGLERSSVSIRIWMTDGDRIGPRSENDLRVIAEVSGDTELNEKLQKVAAAIKAIRAAHISAGFTLSELLLREIPERLPQIDEGGRHVEFTFGGGWVVCVDEIADATEARPHWEVNRLLFEEG